MDDETGQARMERDTQQRRAIRAAFRTAGRPLSPQEVLEAAQTDVPRLGIATVYRNVKALVDEGWLAPVELPGEPPRYEIAGKEHHHHFMCRHCDRVYELDGCSGNLRAGVPRGFRVEGHEVVVYGLCRACAA
jgi:Fur family transcriptional regulator, ferric uptake regulator